MEFGITHKEFNDKRPGSLVGIINRVIEQFSSLYENIGDISEKKVKETTPTCPTCNSTGYVIGGIDSNRMIATELSLKNGAVLLWAGTNCGPVIKIKELAQMIGIDFERPLIEQDKKFTDILLYGYDKEPVTYVHKKKVHKNYYRGCVFDLEYLRDAGTTSKGNLLAIKLFSGSDKCPNCRENFLQQDRLIMGNSLSEVLRMPISESILVVQKLRNCSDMQVLEENSELINDLELRLSYLKKIGLMSLSAFDVRVVDNPIIS